MTKQARRLADALEVNRGDLVAFVGAGGKTGAILTLAEELNAAGWSVLASTTTKVGQRQGTRFSLVLSGQRGKDVPAERPPADRAGPTKDQLLPRSLARRIESELVEHGRVFLASSEGSDGKLSGVPPAWLTALKGCGVADAILVEADGARQRSIKFPDEHEPVIPAASDLVVPIAGVDVLGRRITEATAHRHMKLLSYAGSDTITPDLYVRLLTENAAALKGVPPAARYVPMLTKLERGPTDAAVAIAASVLSARPDRLDHVVLANLRQNGYWVVSAADRTASRVLTDAPR